MTEKLREPLSVNPRERLSRRNELSGWVLIRKAHGLTRHCSIVLDELGGE